MREVEPGQYYYPAQDMHVTVIDLIRATPDFALTPEEEAAYVSAVKLAVEGGTPLKWPSGGWLRAAARSWRLAFTNRG
ncbi:hypothetical protein QPX96_04965 [Limosilactobacillus fermentum]|nr:hypothetical protein [Limosilactobacillus fermentum]